MSHNRYKIEYVQSGSYGSEEKRTLYCDMNCSCDVTTFYEQDGEYLLSFEDTVRGNIFEKMVELIYKKDSPNVKEITGYELNQILKK